MRSDKFYYENEHSEITIFILYNSEISVFHKYLHVQGRIQDFKLGGGMHLKKLRWVEGGVNIFGVFRVKNNDFMPKNHIFSNFRRGSVRQVHSPPLDLPLMYKITSFFVLIVGWSFSFHGKCLADEISKSRSFIICRYCLTCWGACCNMCKL